MVVNVGAVVEPAEQRKNMSPKEAEMSRESAAARTLQLVEEVDDGEPKVNDKYLDIGGRCAHMTKIKQIEVPDYLKERHSTGVDYFNALFGEGLTPSMAILYSGEPGIGKTTMMLEVAEGWTKCGNICLYNTGEEAITQVRCTIDRLQLKGNFYIGNDSDTDMVLQHLGKLKKKHPGKRILFIGDSLQTLNDGKYKMGRNSQTPIRVTKEIVEWCKAEQGIGVLIGQVTKAGKFLGKEEIRHIVDAHVHFWIDQGKKSETYGKRLIQTTKNRYGISNVTHMLEMRKDGLHAVDTLGMTEIEED